MEADLLHHYQVDLLDLWRGRLSYRRLALLIRFLPGDSWTQTALRDAAETDLTDVPADGPRRHGPWALENYQLADLADEIAALRFVVARVNGQEKYPEPKPRARPGAERPVRRQTPAAVAYLKRLRRGS